MCEGGGGDACVLGEGSKCIVEECKTVYVIDMIDG